MSEKISDLSPELRKRAEWLINAGVEDTRHGVAPMTGTDDDIRVLKAAIAHEQSHSNRISRLDILQGKLRKFTQPASHLAQIVKGRKQAAAEVVTAADPEVITPRQAALQDAAKSLQKLRAIIVKHEEAFAALTLGPRLQIGLQCLKAHHAFAIQDQAKKGQGRRPKNQVTRDVISTEGFEGWLLTEAQWLKKPTAYKYMTAVRGLGLNHDATEKQVAAALKAALRKGPVTMAGLVAQAVDPIGPDDNKGGSEQTEFAFLKDSLSAFRQETETLCKLKEKLDAYPDFKRAATARLYAALHELTGTHWAPSDQPDSLALVDPDAITI